MPWFPIVLAVGVGGRLLGRDRGFVLGGLCALFWIVLVQASAGSVIWLHAWSLASMFAGAAAIIAIGGWSGETGTWHSVAGSSESQHQATENPLAVADRSDAFRVNLALNLFEDWLEGHRNQADPWPEFDEFIRRVLFECCGATHVKPFRLMADAQELVPLRLTEDAPEWDAVSSRAGVIGHVATTGQSYLAGDKTHGDLIEKLGKSADVPQAWCFAVSYGRRRLGAVIVGKMDVDPLRNKEYLRTLERLIQRFWCNLLDTSFCRTIGVEDPISGLPARSAFIESADVALQASYGQGEPVAVAIIGFERLRELSDTGRWELADQLVREASALLRAKVRADDRLGRFDGSRLIVLLRRVDSELASLIVAQMAARLEVLCGDQERWGAAVTVRCGLVGTGTSQPTLRDLMTGAVTQCHRARKDNVVLAHDMQAAFETVGVKQ